MVFFPSFSPLPLSCSFSIGETIQDVFLRPSLYPLPITAIAIVILAALVGLIFLAKYLYDKGVKPL